MKKPVTFASSFRIKAALCCSVAVLLTGCGGMADESLNQQLLADTVASEKMDTPSAMATGAIEAGPAALDTVAQETAMPDPAPAPMDDGVAAAAPATQTAGGGPPASNEFNLNGYHDAASASDAATQGTTATAGGDAQQAEQLPTA